ncbi:FKBP-type peptidyl-prolyl cis-trans isomerase [soil metagenome]
MITEVRLRRPHESSTVSTRLISSIALAGALALALAACSSGTDADSASATCSPIGSGASAQKVTVAGSFGAEPEVSFDEGLETEETEREVVTAGTGRKAENGDAVKFAFAVYNGTTGDKLEAAGFGDDERIPLTVSEDQAIAGIVKSLQCSAAGERVVSVVPPTDAFGDQGNETLEVKGTDSLVFVFDVFEVTKATEVLEKADGKAQEAEPGLPTVTLADSGEPTITVPATDPPTELEIANLKTGAGATVEDGDTVTVHYTGVLWKDGSVFDSSWASGRPASFATTGVIPGFGKALVGQKVGSQVIAVIPPSEGYGEAGSGTAISGTDTLVFVIDILATS